MGHSRPTITEEKVGQVRELIIANPEWNRSRLSRELCELWDWKAATGQLKDISCRDLLRDLEAAGAVVLPTAQKISRRAGVHERIAHMEHCTEPIRAELRELTPLRVKIVSSKPGIAEFKSYIDQYHYLGFDRSVGESLKYFITSRDGRTLALLMFGSAAWKCASRDTFIGWSSEDRRANLYFMTNNNRFLIPEWVRVSHLASHVLALIARRLSHDWETKYGHPIYLLETFVETDRFRGTCYKAANWIHVGRTTGRGRDSISMKATLPTKEVWMFPLCKDFREKLTTRTIVEDR
ncbi:MAG: DUF4338 domain-containing protein [Clostridiales bacterium]|jgi:hypothetical protein|nr:DUF4338 domain-containing protein [Clostridiales bacterium]